MATCYEVGLVPGTEVLVHDGNHGAHSDHRSDAILVPQPSNDFHDPLNWDRRSKSTAIGVTMVITFVQILGPLAIAPVFPQLAEDLDASINDVIQFTAYTILALGLAGIVWAPLSDCFGRRPVLLLSELITIAGAVTRACSYSYSQFMVGSVLLGIDTGQSLQPAIIADVVFLHDRGFYNTLFFSTFFAGLQIGPILQGAMGRTLGWRSFWWLNAALNIAGFFIVLFAFPETLYKRLVSRLEQTILVDKQPVTSEAGSVNQEAKLSSHVVNRPRNEAAAMEAPPQPILNNESTWVGRGKPSRKQYHLFQIHERALSNLAKEIYLPFKLITYPIVPWACLVHSFASACYLLISLTQAVALSPPPYSFSVDAVGFTNFASLVGSLIGLLTAGPASDWITMKLTRRNNGIREPEMRLVTMIPYVAVMIVGNFITAFGLQQGWSWEVIVIIGFTCAGIEAPALSAIATTYAVDCYKPAAGAIFFLVTFARDIWGFGLTHFVIEWLLQYGYVAPFMLNFGLLCAWLLCGIAIWAWGKSLRRMTARSWVHQLRN